MLHLPDAQSVGDELVRVDAHLVLTHRAPEVGHVDHVRNGFELFEEHEVFEGPELHQVVPGIGAPQRVPIDLANGAPVGADPRLEALRQVDLREPLEDLLAVPVVHGAVVEDHDHERQAENGLGAQIGHVRHAGHLNFDRNRDLLFHFLCRPARPLRNHLNVVVGHVGIRLHGEAAK